MTRIGSDGHGLFVRAGGYLFRPVSVGEPRRSWRREGRLFADDGETELKAGDMVSAVHRGGSVVAVVKLGDHREHWHAHGEHERCVEGGTRRIPTEEIWVGARKDAPGTTPSAEARQTTSPAVGAGPPR